MSHGAASLHISGAKVASDIQMDANASNALQHMKQQLLNYQVDNKKLSDQLNCLVSLIKRSWTGDKHATVHLSNIVGMEPPSYSISTQISEGSMARPNSQVYNVSQQAKTRSEQNWERMALKLLERDYQAVEQEILEYQQRYIENRQAYMDAVLQDHQQNMARIPLHRKTETVPIDELDSRFIKHNQALQRMGTSLQNKSRRVQSAGVRRRVQVQDRVERMDISLRDLVGDTPSSGHFATAQAPCDPTSNIRPVSILRRPQSSHPSHMSHRQKQVDAYNDASRYLQNNLFALNENDGVKRARPVSASSLRDGDIARSRPRSGRPQITRDTENVVSPAFVTQRNERSLKYETTRPVMTKPKSAQQIRRNSIGSAAKKPPRQNSGKVLSQPQTDVFNASMKRIEAGSPDKNITRVIDSEERGTDVETNSACNHGATFQRQSPDIPSVDYDLDQTEPLKPAVSVRVKSAFTRRPGFIDEFSKDEQAMRDMEEDFKKTALSLQKKLGIDGNGVILF
ncbi:protein Wnt [Elysia marginata]|uniref:Protein Wnt n=1 Tax=Elysia marginata TaxID=1093978 RepID=A0AAV4I889_9GAST|nr:protein Wnt [Elysia marginata]